MGTFAHRTLTGHRADLTILRKEARGVVRDWLTNPTSGAYGLLKEQFFPFNLQRLSSETFPAEQHHERLMQSSPVHAYAEEYHRTFSARSEYIRFPLHAHHARELFRQVPRWSNACHTLVYYLWYRELRALLRSRPERAYPGIEHLWDPKRFVRAMEDLLRRVQDYEGSEQDSQ